MASDLKAIALGLAVLAGGSALAFVGAGILTAMLILWTEGQPLPHTVYGWFGGVLLFLGVVLSAVLAVRSASHEASRRFPAFIIAALSIALSIAVLAWLAND